MQTKNNNNQSPGQYKHTRQELNILRLFKSEHVFLKISVDLQTALTAEAHYLKDSGWSRNSEVQSYILPEQENEYRLCKI
jgi:hypothetical protein